MDLSPRARAGMEVMFDWVLWDDAIWVTRDGDHDFYYM